MSGLDDVGAATERFYLALVIYREARGEPPEGRAAVGRTVLVRAARGGWWGASVAACAVKPLQYSSITDPHDPQVARAWPLPGDVAWAAAWALAGRLLAADPTVPDPAAAADSYHDVSIPPPKWTVGARQCGKIGRLVFYQVRA